MNIIFQNLRKGSLAFYYHGIENEIIEPKVQELHMPISIFESHIHFLRKNFDIISIDYLME